MSGKSEDSAIRELTKTVLSMQNRIISLEKVVTDQNKLLMKLVAESENSGALVKSVQIEVEEGRKAAKATQPAAQRPIRDARVRAVSALTVATRKKEARKVSPAALTARAESSEPLTSSSRSASPTPNAPPTPSAPQLVFVNNAEPPAVTHAQSNEANNGGDWVEVRRRSRRTPSNVTRGTATPGSTGCALSAAERKSYLHLYFVQIGTTTEQVIAHLRNICPDDNCSAEALKSRGDYASFKLTVPTKSFEKYMKPEHWAEDVHIKPWRSGFRKPQQQAGH